MQLCSVEHKLNTSSTFFSSKLDSPSPMFWLEENLIFPNVLITGESNFNENNVKDGWAIGPRTSIPWINLGMHFNSCTAKLEHSTKRMFVHGSYDAHEIPVACICVPIATSP